MPCVGLHYDEEAAAQSRFGGLIVQGGVTSGLLNAVDQDGTVVLDGPALVWTESLRGP